MLQTLASIVWSLSNSRIFQQKIIKDSLVPWNYFCPQLRITYLIHLLPTQAPKKKVLSNIVITSL